MTAATCSGFVTAQTLSRSARRSAFCSMSFAWSRSFWTFSFIENISRPLRTSHSRLPPRPIRYAENFAPGYIHRQETSASVIAPAAFPPWT